MVAGREVWRQDIFLSFSRRMLYGLLTFQMQTGCNQGRWDNPEPSTRSPNHKAFVFSSLIFLHPPPSPNLSLLIFLLPVCSLVRRKPSQHVEPLHIVIMTWRNSLGCGLCCLSGSTSGFALSSVFLFTDIMGLNDLLPETLILSSG